MQSSDSTARLAALDRDLISAAIQKIYQMRGDGDFEMFHRYVAPHAVFENIGDRRVFPFAGRFEGLDAIIEMHQRINMEVEIISWEIRNILIDADEAFSSREVATHHRGTGIQIFHEIWDFWRFENGLVTRSKKLVDASGYDRLLGKGLDS